MKSLSALYVTSQNARLANMELWQRSIRHILRRFYPIWRRRTHLRMDSQCKNYTSLAKLISLDRTSLGSYAFGSYTRYRLSSRISVGQTIVNTALQNVIIRTLMRLQAIDYTVATVQRASCRVLTRRAQAATQEQILVDRVYRDENLGGGSSA